MAVGMPAVRAGVSGANNRTGSLIIISAPSGTGKTTVAASLLRYCPNLVRSVSCTTRPPRPGERHGRDYFFVSENEFARLAAAGDFLEQAVVHGYRYGTLKSRVVKALESGKSVVLTVDVQGAEQVKRAVATAPEGDMLKRRLIDIFLLPPSRKELERRLRARGDTDEALIRLRLRNAERELRASKRFRYRVVNDSLDRTVREIAGVISEESRRK